MYITPYLTSTRFGWKFTNNTTVL